MSGQFLKDVFRYPLIVIGAPLVLGFWVLGWILVIGGIAMALLWFSGEFVALHWPILGAVIAGSAMLSLARRCVRNH